MEGVVAGPREKGKGRIRLANEADILQAWRWRESISLADAWYAAIALRRACAWVTTDRRAAAAAQRLGVTAEVLA